MGYSCYVGVDVLLGSDAHPPHHGALIVLGGKRGGCRAAQRLGLGGGGNVFSRVGFSDLCWRGRTGRLSLVLTHRPVPNAVNRRPVGEGGGCPTLLPRGSDIRTVSTGGTLLTVAGQPTPPNEEVPLRARKGRKVIRKKEGGESKL